MIKTQLYFPSEDLKALHRAARRSRRSVAELVREAVRAVWLRPGAAGPVGLWDGEPRRPSVDHDSIYEELPCDPESRSSSTRARGSRSR